MGLPKFEYVAPKTLSKAVSLQKEGGKYLAGGTDLFVGLKQRICCPELLVDLNKISQLRRIEWDRENGLRVGALTTLTQLKENPVIKGHLSIFSRIVPMISSPQLQNMGTLGGNLCLDTRCYYYNQPAFLKKRWDLCFKIGGRTCHVVKGGDNCYAIYSGDMATPLIAAGAKVKIAGPDEVNEIELQKLFSSSGVKPNLLKFNEILTEILIPPLPEYSGLSYQKLRLRDTMDFPLVGVAVFLHLDGRDGRCQDVRLVLSAVAPSPIVVEDATKLMLGMNITSKLVKEVSKIAQKKAHPVDNTASSAKYRKEMIGILTKKAIYEALDRTKMASH
jgi:4-hydroxybenzoyl-CoA reductase subunit beta